MIDEGIFIKEFGQHHATIVHSSVIEWEMVILRKSKGHAECSYCEELFLVVAVEALSRVD
jgi:hypothetical protein